MTGSAILLLNSISHMAVAFVALRLGLRFKKENDCSLKRPVYFLAGASFLLGLLDILWFGDVILVSDWDNLLIGPLFNLVFLGVWFYICLSMSGHRNINYLIAFFVMGVNTFLVVGDKAFISDLLVSLVLLSLFFHIGLLNRWFAKKISYAGMAYGILIAAVASAAHLMGWGHLEALWFIPNIAQFALVFMIYRQGSFCTVRSAGGEHHVPVVLEVAKLGIFVFGLCIFLMLGMLGIHEVGHSLAAGALGCSHETSYATSFAMTHVECSTSSGNIILLLSGMIMTLLISAVMYIAGNSFIRNVSLLLVAFSLIIGIDDLTSLGFPDSSFIVLVFVSAALIGKGMLLIVKQYEQEYDDENRVCATSDYIAAASAQVAAFSSVQGENAIEADSRLYGRGGAV